MKGFFGTQGNYYEADEPMSPSDTEVPLRPSEAYILSPQGKWVLDRRVVNIAPPAPSMSVAAADASVSKPAASTTSYAY